MKKLIIISTTFFLLLQQMNGQQLRMGINLAQSGANYKLPYGHTNLKTSAGIEIGYAIAVARHFNLLTGVEAFRYRSTATLADNTVYSYNQVDDQGSYFEYRVTTKAYSEKQSFTAVRLPLILQYVTGEAKKTSWYFNGGAKFMLASKVDVNAGAASIAATGYYPDVNAEVHDVPQHGFGTINNWQKTGTYSTKSGWLLTAGTGFGFRLNKTGTTKLYAGLYADYGVNNLQGNRDPLPLVSYNSQNVNNIEANGTMGMSGVEDLNLVNFGMQIKLGFGRKAPNKKSSSTK